MIAPERFCQAHLSCLSDVSIRIELASVPDNELFCESGNQHWKHHDKKYLDTHNYFQVVQLLRQTSTYSPRKSDVIRTPPVRQPPTELATRKVFVGSSVNATVAVRYTAARPGFGLCLQ